MGEKEPKEGKPSSQRGPILGYVGGVPVANPYHSGNLEAMTPEQLEARCAELQRAGEGHEESDEAFMARMDEIDAVEEKLDEKKGGAPTGKV